MRSIIVLLSVFSIFSYPAATFAKNKKKTAPEVKNSLKSENLSGKVNIVSQKVFSLLGDSTELITYKRQYYTEQGFISRLEVYAPDSTLFRQSVFAYDDHSFLVAVFDSTVKGVVTFTLLKNDANGNDTASAVLKRGISKPEFVSKSSMRYDSNGNLIEETDYNNAKELSSVTRNKFDSKGNLIESYIYQKDNTFKEKHVYVYDKKGNEQTSTIYDGSGKVRNKYTYRYEDFDAKGNWQKFTRYNGEKAQISMTRTIEYYP